MREVSKQYPQPTGTRPFSALSMGIGTICFFLWIRTIFSICRMVISLVHFPCEAATRRIAPSMGHGLHASHALSRHRAGGAQCLACPSFLREPEEGTMSRMHHW